MKKMLLILAILVSVNTHSQVLVGTATSTINSSAQLEVSSTSKGFLPPRMTRTELNAIASPTIGLIVYCTDCGPKGKVQIYNGVTWTNPDGTSSELNLPSITTFPIGDTTITNANSGAVVTNTGGSNILFKGVCWSTHKNPTLADSARIGNDSLLKLHSLQPNTTYYVRAVAANAVAIAYGNQLEFKTKKLSIYDHYAGGIVIYLWEENNVQHGVVVSETDINLPFDRRTNNWNSLSSAYQGYGYTDWEDYQSIVRKISGLIPLDLVIRNSLSYVKSLPGFQYNFYTYEINVAGVHTIDFNPLRSDVIYPGIGNNYLGSYNYLIGIDLSGDYDERGYSSTLFFTSGQAYNPLIGVDMNCYPIRGLGHLRAFRSF